MTATSIRRLPGRTGTTPVVVCLAILGAAVVVFALSPSLNPLDILEGRGNEVPVPRVTGLTQDRALVELERARLRGDVRFVYSATVDRNKVVKQKPAADATLGKDSAVVLTVSRGPAFFTLPNFFGVAEKKVRKILSRYDIRLSAERATDEFVPSGSVTSQSPAPGIVAIGGSTVSVRVSTGPLIRLVPNVAGLPVEGAAFKLGKAGFTLGPVTLSDNPTVLAGGVVGTDPPAGAQLPRDTPVKLVVSAGPAPVALPKLTGRKQGDASSQLTALGFLVAEVTQQGVINDPLDGVVMAQSPEEGVQVRPGTIVTITVRRASKPPPTTTPIPIPPPTLPPTTTTIPLPVDTTTTVVGEPTTTVAPPAAGP